MGERVMKKDLPADLTGLIVSMTANFAVFEQEMYYSPVSSCLGRVARSAMTLKSVWFQAAIFARAICALSNIVW